MFGLSMVIFVFVMLVWSFYMAASNGWRGLKYTAIIGGLFVLQCALNYKSILGVFN